MACFLSLEFFLMNFLLENTSWHSVSDKKQKRQKVLSKQAFTSIHHGRSYSFLWTGVSKEVWSYRTASNRDGGTQKPIFSSRFINHIVHFTDSQTKSSKVQAMKKETKPVILPTLSSFYHLHNWTLVSRCLCHVTQQS